MGISKDGRCRRLQAMMIVMMLSSWAVLNVDASTGFHGPGLGNAELRMTCLFYNCRSAPLSDGRFREAFSYMVDRDLVVELSNETVNKLGSFVPEELGEWVSESDFLQFNLTECWVALDEAGYTIDEESNRRIDPQTHEPMRDLILVTPAYQRSPEQWLAGEVIFYYATILRVPLIHATLSDDEVHAQAVRDREYDMIVMDVKVGTPPEILYYLLHSSQDKPSTCAYSGIDDAELDGLLTTLLEGSLTEQRDACRAVQGKLTELAPYAPIYSSTISGPETEITFTFDEATPQTTGTGETEYIAVAFDYIELLDEDERVISKYDMGTGDTSYSYTSYGFYDDKANLDGVETYVWAGGIHKIASVVLRESSEFSYIRMNIRPYVSDNPVHVLVDGVGVGSVTPEAGWVTYTLPEVEEVVPEKMQSSVTCTLSSQSIESGEEIAISGVLIPKLEGASLQLYTVAPDNDRDEYSLTTDSDGAYVYRFKPVDVGEWSVGVGWPGNDECLEASSQERTWRVTEKQSVEPAGGDGDQGGIPGYSMESLIIGVVMTIILLAYIRKGKVYSTSFMRAPLRNASTGRQVSA